MPEASKRRKVEAPLAEQRRQQILAAAAECFRRSGFHGASMADIARSFGMSAGHIYNYFRSKEDIIAAIVERDLAEFVHASEAIRSERDIRAAMVERAELGVNGRLDAGEAGLAIEVAAEGMRNERVRTLMRAADDVARSHLRGMLIACGEPGRPLPDLEARVDVLMALFEGLMLRSLRNPDIDRDAVTRVVRQAVHCLIQGENE